MGYKILIVDDNESNLLIISHILESNLEGDNQFMSAYDGKEAFEIVNKQIPDIIIMDWEMPIMDGIDTLRKLKANANTQHIPVIMATARTSSAHLKEAFEEGVVDYVKKPVDKVELIARVKSVIRLQDSHQEIKRQKEEILQQNNTITQQNQQLNAMNKELQQMNNLKDKLFSVISHDLKSPLNTLTSLLDVFAQVDGITKEDMSKYTSAVQTSLKHVSGLLENLLKWSLSQMKKSTPTPTYFDIKDVIERNIALFSPTAAEKEITLLNNATSCVVYADVDMIDFVIRNLVNNAIKFTMQTGQIHLECEQNTTHANITVTDTGVGIEEERVNTLFQTETLNSTLGTAREKGTGLGLKLCQEYVEQNGGVISVSSIRYKGSTFQFTLPLQEID